MGADWDTIETLFAEALERPEADRLTWLRTACADQPDILREVEAMLASHDRPLGIEPRLLAETNRRQPEPPRNIGPYVLLEQLGQGGMGSVWLGERTDGVLDRKVAVKLVHQPYAESEASTLRRRFESERRILARLEHPGIVRLLEAGTAGGYPYFAMDYVAGERITDFADKSDASLEERLELFTQVCDAVHHAHQRLVVHRDLKPSNILVSVQDDGHPQVKLLDFGIARLLEGEGVTGGDAMTLTETGIRPMTRAYAAPEQLRGEPATTAADVYALGVILYELLAGRHPFEASSPAQLEGMILNETPARPSTVAPGASDARRLRGDLDTIVLKALRKAPADRYGSVEALADDVRRFVQGRPISARPPSASYQLRTFIRRHRLAAISSAAVLLLLVGFTVALAFQRQAMMRERDTARATASFLEGLFGSADPFAGGRQDTLRIADLLDRGVSRARVELADQPLVRARLLFVIGRSFVQLAAQEPAADPLIEAIELSREYGDRATLGGSLAELAAVRNTQFQLAEAEALAHEAMDIAMENRDESLRRRAENVLVLTLLNANRHDEAEELLRASLGRIQSQPGASLDVLMGEAILGRLLLDQGRFDEAEAVLLALRDRYTTEFGAADPRQMAALNPLTFLYLMQGRLDEAGQIGAEAVEIVRDAHPGSSALGELLSSYGAVLRRLGRLDEAEAAFREALTLPSTRPGARAIPLGGLANVLYEKDDLVGAIQLQREAVSMMRTDSTMDRASVMFSTVKLVGFLTEARRFEEAEEALLAASAEQEFIEAQPSGSMRHGSVDLAAEFVRLYNAWGRPDKASAWIARSDAN